MQFTHHAWSKIKSSFNCRLCWSITTGVFFAILVVEAVILLFSVNNYERDRLAELEREAVVVMRSIIRSAVDQDDPVFQLARIGENLRTNSVLAGAQIYDDAGRIVAEFGELPDVSQKLVGSSTQTIRQKRQGSTRLDIIWPPSRIKAPYYVAARIDTSEISGQITAFIWRIIGLVLLISVFVTIVTMVVLERMVLLPIRKLRDCLLISGNDPDRSEKYILEASRSDELGDVMNAFNLMLRQTGENFSQIKKQGEELEKHRNELELLVLERTAKLEAAKQAAVTANEAKSEFVAHMSHELRTPLNAIIGLSQMWMDQVMGPIKNQKYLEYAKDINDSGSQLLHIISGILDLTKLEEGKAELDVSEINLGTAIADCMTEFAQSSDEKGIKLQTCIAPELSIIRADQRLLRRILSNVISNAVKFTLPGGRVDIGANLQQDGSTTITISDTGIGIRAEDLSMVLEPFGQVRGSAHVAHEGTGLGLPLAKQLTEMHDGTLEIDSEIGKGTTVSMNFPVDHF